MQFNIICASHNDAILNKNLASTYFFRKYPSQVVKGYTNIAAAYNFASKPCNALLNEYNVYVHHDVFMTANFEPSLKRAIFHINSLDTNWGVLGLAGATLEKGARKFYGHIRDRAREWGTSFGLPKEVQTLDELLLITKGDFVFDEEFTQHFYGADICLKSISEGRKNYAISAYCYHNSSLKYGYRSDSFRECEQRLREKWKSYLPIVTTCTLLNK